MQPKWIDSYRKYNFNHNFEKLDGFSCLPIVEPTRPTTFASSCQGLRTPSLQRGDWACNSEQTRCAFVCPRNFLKSRNFEINCVCSRNQCRWVGATSSLDFSAGWRDVNGLACWSQAAARTAVQNQFLHSPDRCQKPPKLPETTKAIWTCKNSSCLLSCPVGWRKNRLVKISCFCTAENDQTEEQCNFKLYLTKSGSYSDFKTAHWFKGLNFKCVQK